MSTPSTSLPASPSSHSDDPPSRSEIAKWKKIVAKFEVPNAKRATWQLVTTLGAYFGAWAAMHFALQVSYWLLIPLILLAGGLLVRVFIIFHDCCHQSFYKSSKLNRALGFFTGMLCFTSYKHWRWEHSVHHATSGDLDRRGIGDIWTVTVDEYLRMPKWRRLSYRAARNPIILFGLAPLMVFLVFERIPSKKAKPVTRRAVWWTNLAIVGMLAVGCLLFGIVPFLLLQLGVIATAATAGVWMFYIQHQFEGVYWERHEHWDYTSAALEGSSFYKLPKVLQWFTGNIGFHHIHHLSSKVPNYYLQACHESNPAFSEIEPVTMIGSLKSIGYRLWDEADKELVGWRRMREIRRERQLAASAS